jgi:hypothetical protein
VSFEKLKEKLKEELVGSVSVVVDDVGNSMKTGLSSIFDIFSGSRQVLGLQVKPPGVSTPRLQLRYSAEE